jgi:hypothetical protein
VPETLSTLAHLPFCSSTIFSSTSPPCLQEHRGQKLHVLKVLGCLAHADAFLSVVSYISASHISASHMLHSTGYIRVGLYRAAS